MRALVTGSALLAGALTLAAIAAQFAASGTAAAWAAIMAWVLAGVTAVTGNLVSALWGPPNPTLRTAARLLTAASACWLAGAIAAAVAGPGKLSPYTAGFWLCFPLVRVVGFLRRLPRFYIFAVATLDAIPVVLVAHVMGRIIAPIPTGFATASHVMLFLFSTLYVLVAANGIQLVGVHVNLRTVPGSVLMLAAGLCVMALAAVFWTPTAVTGTVADSWLSSLWPFGLLLLGAAGLVRADPSVPFTTLPPVEKESGPHALPPAGAVLALIIILPITPSQNRLALEVFLLVAALSLFLRVYLIRRQDRRLLAELARSRQQAQAAAERAGESARRMRLLAGQLAGQNDRLRELDRMKDEFVALVSHEIRTPLTSIGGYLELLADRTAGTLNRQQNEFIQVIARNTKRLLHLVDDLLFLSRIQSGKLPMEFAEIDLTELVRHAIAEAGPAAAAKGISISLSAAHGPRLRADPARLAQLAGNLLSNAVKFTPARGRVTATVGTQDDTAVFSVADTGIGIPVADRDRIFDRFYRAPTATDRAIPGTGLGLTISKAIVQAHEGSISVNSAPGQGTTVSVRIPLHTRPARENGRGGSSAHIGGSRTSR